MNDIIKALEELLEIMLCEGDLQRSATISKALDLINRQKAEIERYREVVGELGVKDGEVVALLNGKETAYTKKDIAETLKRMDVKTAKAEAIKEFAERLKREKRDLFCIENIDGLIDNLVKEMVGDV